MISRIMIAFVGIFLTISTLAAPARKSINWMFVILSSKAKVVKTAQGYQLTMKKENIEKVLTFSDRPYRLVKHITGSSLKSLWAKGANSFKRNPPNAVLVVNNKLDTIVLNSYNITRSKMVFGISSDDGSKIKTRSGASVLFIDGCGHWGGPGGPPWECPG